MKSLLRHISDAGQDVGQPGARINAVPLSGLDQAVHGGGALSVPIRGAPPFFLGESSFICSYERLKGAHKYGGQ